ncbi:MAG: GvpL/GvpF family gas vesicle protein [Planctomycetota bacterium]|nr:GvpL/GvpF family gas vesicle protein [Planctomycetota bacterium]
MSSTRYVYAVTRALEGERWNGDSRIPAGLGDRAVAPVLEGELAVWVSEPAGARIRPERRNLVAHQRVVRALADNLDALPVSFGMVLPSESACAALLRDHSESMLQALDRIEGKLEMSVRVTLASDNAFAFFVEQDPELRHARDRMARGGGSRDELLEVGKLFERVLERERDRAMILASASLAPATSEIHRHPARNEKELLNLACLVSRDAVAAFDAAVHEAAASFDDRYAFDFSGPWPCHSFTNLRINAPEADEVESAARSAAGIEAKPESVAGVSDPAAGGVTGVSRGPGG